MAKKLESTDQTCPVCHTSLDFEIGEAASREMCGEIEFSDITCPKCQAEMDVRVGRYVKLTVKEE